MRRAMLAVAVLGLIAATTDRARAEMTVDFSYSGRGVSGFAGLFDNGTGTFTFADGVENLGPGDLTSFSFTLNESEPNVFSNTVTFGLSDLDSFSAFVDPTRTVTVLDLTTGAVQGSNSTTEEREFGVSSFAPGGASTYFVFLGAGFQQTSGTVTAARAVPEPSALALGVVGGAIVGGWWRRR